MIFETHAHYDDNKFDKDREELIKSLPEKGIKRIINVGASIETTKTTIEIARKYDFSVASRPDSEDICFIPDGNYKRFLEENSDISPKPGNIVDSKGNILGKHTGCYW